MKLIRNARTFGRLGAVRLKVACRRPRLITPGGETPGPMISAHRCWRRTLLNAGVSATRRRGCRGITRRQMQPFEVLRLESRPIPRGDPPQFEVVLRWRNGRGQSDNSKVTAQEWTA